MGHTPPPPDPAHPGAAYMGACLEPFPVEVEKSQEVKVGNATIIRLRVNVTLDAVQRTERAVSTGQ